MRAMQWIISMALLCGAAAVAAGPVVEFQGDLINAREGDVFAVQIVMRDFPMTEGGGFDLRFDPSLLQARKVLINQKVWSFAARSGAIDNAVGTISNVLFSSYGGVSGRAEIATIEFEVLRSGEGRLELSPSRLNPFAGNGRVIDVGYRSIAVIVGAK